jgi:hypothetical protein
MSRTKVSSIKSYFTKAINAEATHAWYSCKPLTDEEVELLKAYLKEKKYLVAMFVRNVVPGRPERTWGSLPTWFRPASEYRSFNDCPIEKGDFVFIHFEKEEVYANKEKIDEFLDNVYNKCLRTQEKYVYLDGKLNMEESD